MIPTDEQIFEARDKFADVAEAEGYAKGAKWAIEQMKEELNIELGKCECGQEHDIRFMQTDQEGNHICHECYTLWAVEIYRKVKELMKLRVSDSMEDVKYNCFTHELVDAIDNLGEAVIGIRDWHEDFKEELEYENMRDHTKGVNE